MLGSTASGVIGLILAFLLFLQGFAALRRPLSELVKNDPVGRKMIERRGEAFARRMYRILGASFVLLGLVCAYLALGILRGGQAAP